MKDLQVGDRVRNNSPGNMERNKLPPDATGIIVFLLDPGKENNPTAAVEIMGRVIEWSFDYLELVSPRMMLKDPLFSLEELTEFTRG